MAEVEIFMLSMFYCDCREEMKAIPSKPLYVYSRGGDIQVVDAKSRGGKASQSRGDG